jgi:uncharacterized membrane protein
VGVAVFGLVALGSIGAGRSEAPRLEPLPGVTGHDNHQAWSANDSGTIVGHAGYIAEDPDTPPTSIPARWTRSGVELLDGPLVVAVGDEESEYAVRSGIAVGVNNAGAIAGDIFSAAGRRAATWDETSRKWRALPLPSGLRGAGARGINSSGAIVGSGGGRVIVWRDRTPEVLPTPEGYLGCSAFAINDPGDVAGQCFAEGDAGQVHAVAWFDGLPTVLGGMGETAFGRAINNAGLVVGFDGDYVDISPPGAATAWEDGDAVVLAYPGAANGVNNAGRAAGYVGVNGGEANAAYWSDLDAEPTVFEPLDGDEGSWFRDINNTGLAVGFSTGPDGYTAVTARP